MSASQATKRPCNQTLEQHSRKVRKASSKTIKRGDLGHSTEPARFASLQTAGNGVLKPSTRATYGAFVFWSPKGTRESSGQGSRYVRSSV